MKKKRKMFAGLKIMSTFATQMRNKLTQSKCPDGGIGRRVGLKHQWIHDFHLIFVSENKFIKVQLWKII